MKPRNASGSRKNTEVMRAIEYPTRNIPVRQPNRARRFSRRASSSMTVNSTSPSSVAS